MDSWHLGAVVGRASSCARAQRGLVLRYPCITLNRTLVGAVGRRRECHLTLVRADVARPARGAARSGSLMLRMPNSCAGVTRLASDYGTSHAQT